MDDDLSKSRRNLIVLSALLLIFDIASVSIGKVSVLGTELIIGNAQILPFLLWSIWAYMLLRYVQLLGAQPHLGLLEKFNERMNWHLRDLLPRLVAEASPTDWKPWSGTVKFETLKRSGLHWYQDLEKYDQTPTPTVVGRVTVPSGTMLLSLVRSLLFVVFATPRVTDHIFPLALALAAPIAALYG